MLKGISLYNLLTEEFNDMTFVNTVSAMNQISKQIEDIVMDNALPVDFFAGFQRHSFFLAQLERFKILAKVARRVYIIGVPDADVPLISGIEYIPLEEGSHLAQEWFLVVNTPSFYTTLLTKEIPGRDPITGQRRFRGAWTFDEEVVNQAYLLLTQFLGNQFRPVRQRSYDVQSSYVAEVANNLIVKLEDSMLAQSQNARLNKALTNLAKTLADDLPLDKIMDHVVADLSAQFQAQTVSIWEPNTATAEIVMVGASGLPSNWRNAAYRNQPISNINLVATQAYNDESLVYVRNTQKEGRPDMFDPTAKSIIAVPMQAQGKLLGILQMTNSEEDAFNTMTQNVISAIGSQAAMIMLTLKSKINKGNQPPTAAANGESLAILQSRIEQLNDEILSLLSLGASSPKQMQVVNRIVQINTELSSVGKLLNGGNGPKRSDALPPPQSSSFGIDFMMDFGEEVFADTPSPARGVLKSKNDKLDFISQLSSKEFVAETIDVNNIVEQIIAEFHAEAVQAEIEIEQRTHEDMPPLIADRELLYQAITQLVDNSIKYSGAGSQISILSNTDGDSVVIAVRDTGRGIRMEDLPFVFNEGYRGQNEIADGDGLGLALVEKVAEKHNGKAWIRSKPDQGSIAFVRVPLAR